MVKILSVSLLLMASTFSILHAKTPPQVVLNAFNQKFPGVKDVDWDLEKNGEWEAEFDGTDGKDMSANFSADGKWLETETEIAFSELPQPVQNALKGKKVKEAARIERMDGKTVYEAEVNHKDLIFDASGKLLK